MTDTRGCFVSLSGMSNVLDDKMSRVFYLFLKTFLVLFLFFTCTVTAAFRLKLSLLEFFTSLILHVPLQSNTFIGGGSFMSAQVYFQTCGDG